MQKMVPSNRVEIVEVSERSTADEGPVCIVRGPQFGSLRLGSLPGRTHGSMRLHDRPAAKALHFEKAGEREHP